MLLIAFLWGGYFLSYCDRQAVYSIFPVLKAELGFTNTQLGLTGSIFLWATGLASPLAGPLSERRSKARLAAGTLLLWSAATFLTGFAATPALLLACRALLGVTEALFVPLSVALIGDALPPHMTSRAVGAFFTAQLFGVIAGGSLGGWIAQHLGWRVAFWLLGAAGAVYVVPLYRFLNGMLEEPVARRQQPAWHSTLALFRVPTFTSLCICFPSFLLLITVIYAWFAAFLYERFALGLAEAGFLSTIYVQGGTALGLLTGSYLSDRLSLRHKPARFWVLAAAMLFGAPWVHLMGHAASLQVSLAAAAGFGVANGMFIANLMVAPFDVVPLSSRTAAIAILNTIAPPLSGLATLFAGMWKERIGLAGLLSILALLTFVAGAALLTATHFLFAKDHAKLAALQTTPDSLL